MTRRTVVRTKAELRAALALRGASGRSDRARPDDGRAPRGPSVPAARCQRALRPRRHEPVREPGAVRPGRGPRELPARRGPRPGPGRADRRRHRLRARGRARSIRTASPPASRSPASPRSSTATRRGAGASHFRGVTTVVAKLLNIVAPDVALLRAEGRPAGDRDPADGPRPRLPGRDRRGPTVREPDGLALSSRNAYLAPEDRERASGLHRALRAAARCGRSGQGHGRGLGSRAKVVLAEAGHRARVPRGALRRRPHAGSRASTDGPSWWPSPRGSAGPA